MIATLMANGCHQWEKVNLTTLKDKSGLYDLYKCRNCGLKGKSYSLEVITVRDNQAKKLFQCPNPVKHKKLRVTNLRAYGPAFSNLTNGSIHDIVEPPQPETIKRGEWVMGVGEKVLLLYYEFTYVEEEGNDPT